MRVSTISRPIFFDFPFDSLFPTSISLNCALTYDVFTSTGAHHGGQGEGPQNQGSVQDHPVLNAVSEVAVLTYRAMMWAELRGNSKEPSHTLSG